MALVLLQILEGIGSQFLTYATDQMFSIGRENIPLMAFIASVELVMSFLLTALWTLAICSAVQEREEWEAVPLGSRFNQLMIEQVRGLASVIWRMPLFLVPAIVQYIRLRLLPFIVVLDRAYLRGEVDALQMSRKLSRGHFWLLTAFVVATALLQWIADDLVYTGGGRYFLFNPLGVGIEWALTLAINLFSSVFLLEVFRGLFNNTIRTKSSTTDQSTIGLFN